MRIPLIVALAAAAVLAVGCKKKTDDVVVAAGAAGTADALPAICSTREDLEYEGQVYPGAGPVSLSDTDARNRHGIAQRNLSVLQTSKERPVEVCGVRAELTWLVYAECADGSHPFEDGQQAHAARSGNVGPGGRCGSIVDLYMITCPEETYEVYMDMYMCGADESMQ